MDIRLQAYADNQDVAGLMKAAFGGERSNRAVWHLRPGQPVSSLCLVASFNHKICASLRFWEVLVCGRCQLLLGPLAVQPELRGKGFGRALVIDGLRRAQQHNKWDFVMVSGDLIIIQDLVLFMQRIVSSSGQALSCLIFCRYAHYIKLAWIICLWAQWLFYLSLLV